MLRKIVSATFLLLLVGGVVYGQWLNVYSRDPKFIVNQPALAAATASDTITGPVIEIEQARRVSFRLRTNAGICSLGFVYVSNNETLSTFKNADGLPGLIVASDVDGAAPGTSGLAIDLIASGPNRIRYRFARPVVLPKCCVPAQLDSMRWDVKVQMD